MPEHTDHDRATTRLEQGFSMMELIVVMTIVAILGAIAMIAFHGAKASASMNEAKSTASSYAQAVSQYQNDHGRRNPPDMAGNNGDVQQRGPKNLVGAYYLRSVSDSVTAGRVGVTWVSSPAMNGACASGGKPSPADASTQTGWVTICLGADPAYAVRVSARANSSASWADEKSISCFTAGSGIERTPAC